MTPYEPTVKHLPEPPIAPKIQLSDDIFNSIKEAVTNVAAVKPNEPRAPDHAWPDDRHRDQYYPNDAQYQPPPYNDRFDNRAGESMGTYRGGGNYRGRRSSNDGWNGDNRGSDRGYDRGRDYDRGRGGYIEDRRNDRRFDKRRNDY